MAEPEQVYAQLGRRANSILVCTGNIVASRTRVVIVTLCLAKVRLHLKCCIPFSHYKKNIEFLDHVQRRTMKLVYCVQVQNIIGSNKVL